jgi:hypothetical protein
MSDTLFDLVTKALAEAGIDYSGKTWAECLELYAKLGLPPWIQGDSDWSAFEECGIGDT